MLNKLLAIINDKSLRNRILFTFMILFVFRLGASITIPGVIIQENITANSIFGIMNLLGGGALAQFSLFALGVSPYITASIIVQLLTMDVIPSWTEYAKSGEIGRKKISRITKWVALILSFVQAFALTISMSNQGIIRFENTNASMLFIVLILVAGASFTVWLGDQISDKGIGNGLSIIIFGGIVASMPYQLAQTYQIFVAGDTAQKLFSGLLNFGFYLSIWLLVISFMVYFDAAIRKIPIQYSHSYDISRQEEVSFLPIKLNISSVIPIIFASAVLAAPVTIASFFPNTGWAKFIIYYFNLNNLWGMIAYLVMIFGFTFFQAHGTINAKDIAEGFEKSSSFIPGVRSGQETEKYLKRIINRLCFFGATFLISVAALPFITSAVIKVSAPLIIGGSAMIIVIGVSLETARQIQGSIMQTSYTGFTEKGQLNEREIQERLESVEW